MTISQNSEGLNFFILSEVLRQSVCTEATITSSFPVAVFAPHSIPTEKLGFINSTLSFA